jgi:hypothetical protein
MTSGIMSVCYLCPPNKFVTYFPVSMTLIMETMFQNVKALPYFLISYRHQ